MDLGEAAEDGLVCSHLNRQGIALGYYGWE